MSAYKHLLITEKVNHEGTICEGTKVRLQIQLLSIFVETEDMRGLEQVRETIPLFFENLYEVLHLHLNASKIELRPSHLEVLIVD